MILGIPVLDNPDIFKRCLDSIDHDVDLVIVDNSGSSMTWGIVPDDAHIIEPVHNLGYAASVNLIIKATPHEDAWLFANADTEFAPGDLSRLLEQTQSGEWGWVGLTDWRAFGLTSATVERVGFWDEHFIPCYCEDADYERRCTLAGIRWGFIQGETTHVGSVSLRQHYADNQRSYPENVRYYCDKWGVSHVRAPGGYTTPFARGGSLADGTQPDLSRLRRLAWR